MGEKDQSGVHLAKVKRITTMVALHVLVWRFLVICIFKQENAKLSNPKFAWYAAILDLCVQVWRPSPSSSLPSLSIDCNSIVSIAPILWSFNWSPFSRIFFVFFSNFCCCYCCHWSLKKIYGSFHRWTTVTTLDNIFVKANDSILSTPFCCGCCSLPSMALVGFKV